MSWIALLLVLIASPLQVLSHATTCNNGDYSAFLMGSVTTTPLLAGAALLLLRGRAPTGWRAAATPAIITTLVVVLIVDSDVVWNAMAYGTPCGVGFRDALVRVALGHLALIIIAYLVMPLVNIGLAIRMMRRGRSASAK